MAQLAQLIDDVVVSRFEIDDQPLTIGRHPDSRIQIEDGAVSSFHAVISLSVNADFADFHEVVIEDLGSTNGTLVNGERISGKVGLHNGDIVRIGWNEFKLVDVKEPKLARTVHMIQD